MREKELPPLPPEMETPDESHLTEWERLVSILVRECYWRIDRRQVVSLRLTIRVVEHLYHPQSPREITTQRAIIIERYLREQLHLASGTVYHYMRALKTLLTIAHIRGLADEPPSFVMAKRVDRRRGRAVKREEYLRMIQHVEANYGHLAYGRRWLFVLRTLWHSGLRLGEISKLTWEPSNFYVDLSGRRPMFRIGQGGDKSGRAGLLPIAPKFAKLLLTVPKENRIGRVCNMHVTTIGDMVRRMANEAGCYTIMPNGEKQLLTPHDFRRAFACRWSRQMSPDKLMLLMRHTDYKTTLHHYIESKSEDVAEEMWRMGRRPHRRNTLGLARRAPVVDPDGPIIVTPEDAAPDRTKFPYVPEVHPLAHKIGRPR